jgi:hypothetical protein
VTTTVIALLTLVTLRRLKPTVRRRFGSESLALELRLVPGGSVRTLLGELRRQNVRVDGMESQVLEDGTEHLRLDVRAPATLDVDTILSALSQMREVARIDLVVPHSLDLESDEEESLPTERQLRVRRLLVPARRLARPRSRRSATPRARTTPPRSEPHPAEHQGRVEPTDSGDNVGVNQSHDHQGALGGEPRTR